MMMKLVLAGSAALMLGLASANAAPIRAPALGDAVASQTTTVQVMNPHEGMRMMHHRRMEHRMMRHRMMMRHHHMHRRMMHRM